MNISTATLEDLITFFENCSHPAYTSNALQFEYASLNDKINMYKITAAYNCYMSKQYGQLALDAIEKLEGEIK
jgi:hypothetical protein